MSNKIDSIVMMKVEEFIDKKDFSEARAFLSRAIGSDRVTARTAGSLLRKIEKAEKKK